MSDAVGENVAKLAVAPPLALAIAESESTLLLDTVGVADALAAADDDAAAVGEGGGGAVGAPEAVAISDARGVAVRVALAHALLRGEALPEPLNDVGADADAVALAAADAEPDSVARDTVGCAESVDWGDAVGSLDSLADSRLLADEEGVTRPVAVASTVAVAAALAEGLAELAADALVVAELEAQPLLDGVDVACADDRALPDACAEVLGDAVELADGQIVRLLVGTEARAL